MMTRLAAALACLTLLAPSVARSQSADPAAPAATASSPAPAAAPAAQDKSYRELGGHLFLPTHVMGDPFSYTAAGLFWGAGQGTSTGPTIHLYPPPATIDRVNLKDYDYLGLALGLVMNVRILEYLSVYAQVDAGAYVGDSGESFLAVGTNAKLGGAVGVKGSLPIGERVRVSAAVGAEYGPIFTALIAQGLIDALNSGQITADQFLQSNTALTWTANANAAWAPWDFLGFTGQVKFFMPTGSGNIQYASNGFSAAAMADFDLRPLVSWLPLGANATYAILTPLGGTLATSQDYGVGIYYTGRKELAAGIEIDWRRGRLDGGLDSKQTLAWLNLRYYWGN